MIGHSAVILCRGSPLPCSTDIIILLSYMVATKQLHHCYGMASCMLLAHAFVTVSCMNSCYPDSLRCYGCLLCFHLMFAIDCQSSYTFVATKHQPPYPWSHLDSGAGVSPSLPLLEGVTLGSAEGTHRLDKGFAVLSISCSRPCRTPSLHGSNDTYKSTQACPEQWCLLHDCWHYGNVLHKFAVTQVTSHRSSNFESVKF